MPVVQEQEIGEPEDDSSENADSDQEDVPASVPESETRTSSDKLPKRFEDYEVVGEV